MVSDGITAEGARVVHTAAGAWLVTTEDVICELVINAGREYVVWRWLCPLDRAHAASGPYGDQEQAFRWLREHLAAYHPLPRLRLIQGGGE